MQGWLEVSLSSMILPCLWFFQKILLFPEMRVTRKTFTRVAAFFLLIDFPAIFFFAFFLLFLLFVFWNEKYIFWYTLDFPGEWVIKNFLPGRFLETRLLFFTLHIANLQFESQQKACHYLKSIIIHQNINSQ